MVVCANSNQPWNSALPTLALLPKCRTLSEVKQIHARLTTTGLINNSSLTAKLILTFCASPHAAPVRFARYLFFLKQACQFRNSQLDSFIWNAVIKTFSHGDHPREAMVLFLLMLETGVFVDNYSFSLVLKACSRMGLVKEGMQVHGLMTKFDFGPDDALFLKNCLICLYMRGGYPGLARQIFDRMPKWDSVSFNLMIDGYAKCGMVDFARELFDCMPVEMKNLISWNSMISGYVKSKEGLKIAWELFKQTPERDLVSWNLMIYGCVKCWKVETAQALFDEMPQKDVISWASMIDAYGKLGRINIARALFDKMPDRDVISCNTMMAGYVQNGHCTEAIKLFHDMQSETNLSPDDATLSIALSAIAQLGLIDEGVAVHCYIKDNGLLLGGKLGVALIDMYSKCGSIERAMQMFENVKERSVDHWNAMINGLAIHGCGELAFEFFMKMAKSSIRPDDITFIGVLNACGHAGLVKEGLMCFELMRRVHRVEPKLQHYGCVVDILGRAGHIEEATKLIGEMPIEPNDVIWRTLLSACNNHENFKIGEAVAKHLIGLDCHKSSGYVLLSNMYACFGMWNDVRKVKAMMKDKDVKKMPGCSWIEVEGIVHEFFAGDKSYPQVAEIYPVSNITHLIQSPYTIGYTFETARK